MFRFSLLTLLCAVLVAAIGFAALANPTGTWRQVVVTGTVLVLLVAVLFAVSKRPMPRFALRSIAARLITCHPLFFLTCERIFPFHSAT
jgi:uncharacterized membrane protein YjjP (DUF1212 family)